MELQLSVVSKEGFSELLLFLGAIYCNQPQTEICRYVQVQGDFLSRDRAVFSLFQASSSVDTHTLTTHKNSIIVDSNRQVYHKGGGTGGGGGGGGLGGL